MEAGNDAKEQEQPKKETAAKEKETQEQPAADVPSEGEEVHSASRSITAVREEAHSPSHVRKDGGGVKTPDVKTSTDTSNQPKEETQEQPAADVPPEGEEVTMRMYRETQGAIDMITEYMEDDAFFAPHELMCGQRKKVKADLLGAMKRTAPAERLNFVNMRTALWSSRFVPNSLLGTISLLPKCGLQNNFCPAQPRSSRPCCLS